jgi:hypothetical protein
VALVDDGSIASVLDTSFTPVLMEVRKGVQIPLLLSYLRHPRVSNILFIASSVGSSRNKTSTNIH